MYVLQKVLPKTRPTKNPTYRWHFASNRTSKNKVLPYLAREDTCFRPLVIFRLDFFQLNFHQNVPIFVFGKIDEKSGYFDSL